MATVMDAKNWKTGICTLIFGIYRIILTTDLIYQLSNELAAQIDIITPFGGLFVAMYTINHGPIKFQIRHQKKEIKSPYFISRYLLQNSTTNNIKSLTITPHLPYYPPLISVKKWPEQTK